MAEQSSPQQLDTELTNTSDITMLAFLEIAQAAANTDLPTPSEQRTFSNSRPPALHSSGRPPQPDTAPLPPQRLLSSPLDSAPSPDLVLSPTSPPAEDPLNRSLAATLEAMQEPRLRPNSFSSPSSEQVFAKSNFLS